MIDKCGLTHFNTYICTNCMFCAIKDRKRYVHCSYPILCVYVMCVVGECVCHMYIVLHVRAVY